MKLYGFLVLEESFVLLAAKILNILLHCLYICLFSSSFHKGIKRRYK